jgi:hypothetical protein
MIQKEVLTANIKNKHDPKMVTEKSPGDRKGQSQHHNNVGIGK